MLRDNERGYAVMSEDRSGTSFEDRSLETCKRYCREGYIIVEVKPVVIGFGLRVWMSRHDRAFSFSGFGRRLNLFGLNVSWHKEYGHCYGEEVWKKRH